MPREKITYRQCDFCGHALDGEGLCRSCEFYEAAVHAQQAAARSLAESRGFAGHAWLNEHGVFVQPDDGSVTRVLGTAEEAKPFVELPMLARAAVRGAQP